MPKLAPAPKPRPEPRPASAELRAMMFVTWGEHFRAGKLHDVDRAAHLHAIVNDPCQDLAFGELSRADKMLICAHRLMENNEWAAAYRVLAGIERIDLERQRLALRRREPPPEPAPDATPEPAPGPTPGPTPGPMLLNRRWPAAVIAELAEKHPGLADMTPEETMRILADFTPAPDT